MQEQVAAASFVAVVVVVTVTVTVTGGGLFTVLKVNKHHGIKKIDKTVDLLPVEAPVALRPMFVARPSLGSHNA